MRHLTNKLKLSSTNGRGQQSSKLDTRLYRVQVIDRAVQILDCFTAVAWLANAVGQFGVSLEPGEVIMPGAFCAAADVAAGDLLQASFDGLGSVSVRFV